MSPEKATSLREAAFSSHSEPNVEDTGGRALPDSDRLQFDTLLSNLSARFVNVPTDQVDHEIEDALRQILTFFQSDRCALLELFPDRKVVRVSHIACADGVELVSKDIDLAALFPWYYTKLIVEHQYVAISTPEDLPEEAQQDRQSHIALGNTASLDMPLLFGGHARYIFSMNVMRQHYLWPKEYVPRLRLLGEVFVNALEHKRTTQQLDERLQFETLLADLSARFVDVPSDHVDREIENAQRRVCECLRLDLSSLWQWTTEAPRYLMLSHLYRPLGGPPLPERSDAGELFPWCVQQLLEGKVIVVSSMEDLPAEAARDQEVWRHYGIKTSLTVPLFVGEGPLIGALSFNTVRAERTWPGDIVKRLQLVAQVIANALARKQSDRALRESEERLSLAADSAGAGLWSLALASGRYWVTEKGRELFDFTADEVVTFDRVLESVHPDDRELIHRTVPEVVESRKECSVEYRIIRADGSVRWIASRGRVHCDESGKPDYLMGVSVDVTDRKRMEQQLQDRLHEIEDLKQQLERENIYLRREVEHFEEGDIIGSSTALIQVLAQAEQVAPTDSTVLLLGETGTGKELIAQAIHNHSKRKGRVMVKVDCASLPAALIESELFGREKGAYTGALTRQAGRFEIADGSTIFLDEIGEMPLELQAKLLRVLQDGEFERLGSPRKIRVDVRVIAATNRDLVEAVKKGAFREDLFYRLNVFPIEVPPLRERPEDIPVLVQAFVNEFSGKMGKKIRTIPKGSIEALQRYGWPGNIRELRNLIEQAVIISDSDILKMNVPLQGAESPLALLTLEEAEYMHIVQILEKTGWRIKGPHGAAALLGLKPSTLYSRMSKLNIPTRREKDDLST